MDLPPVKRHRLLLLGLALFAFDCAFFHLTCVDIGFHVRTGELVVQNGAIPSVNMLPITYFPDPFWQNLIKEFHSPAGSDARMLTQAPDHRDRCAGPLLPAGRGATP